MGYCYTKGGSLICDRCGAPGATKHSCAHGWCPQAALCATCWADLEPRWSTIHARCAAPAALYRERFESEQRILRDGGAVLRSAISRRRRDGTKTVHALFEVAGGQRIGFYIPPEVYDQRLKADPATVITPAFFGLLGPIEAAPWEFSDGRTTKEVGIEEFLKAATDSGLRVGG